MSGLCNGTQDCQADVSAALAATQQGASNTCLLNNSCPQSRVTQVLDTVLNIQSDRVTYAEKTINGQDVVVRARPDESSLLPQ